MAEKYSPLGLISETRTEFTCLTGWLAETVLLPERLTSSRPTGIILVGKLMALTFITPGLKILPM